MQSTAAVGPSYKMVQYSLSHWDVDPMQKNTEYERQQAREVTWSTFDVVATSAVVGKRVLQLDK